jgi:hypothetical protein
LPRVTSSPRPSVAWSCASTSVPSWRNSVTAMRGAP